MRETIGIMLKNVFLKRIDDLIAEAEGLKLAFDKYEDYLERPFLLKAYDSWKDKLRHCFERFFSEKKAIKYYNEIMSMQSDYDVFYENCIKYSESLVAFNIKLTEFKNEIEKGLISRTEVGFWDIVKNILGSLALPSIALSLLLLFAKGIPIIKMVINVLVFLLIGLIIYFPVMRDKLKKTDEILLIIMNIANFILFILNLLT